MFNGLEHWRSLSFDRQKELAYSLKAAFALGDDNFTSLLLRLISKADAKNIERLSRGFPDECALMAAWHADLLNDEFRIR
jgi:hypothetical protein